ncbi:MAG: N-acetylmuramoyl-L-alanine amidase family protein [Clostridium sp.]|uniref:N-acetylmuramoyl-L-alanine amidase family protein n=1 Tax=Clostridium sp. TaxID=1506 RepID=UPI003D6D9E56
MTKINKNRKLKTKFLIRRIVTISVFLGLILMLSSFFIKAEVSNKLVIGNIENASISFKENEFYKKYTINCTESITNFNPKEDMDKFQINLDKSKLLNIDITKLDKFNSSEINIEDNKDLFTLTFNKLTGDENYAHLDYGNDTRIMIFIKKKESSFKYNVVIDPGHGGVDVGAFYGKLCEKDLTLKISKYMVDNLRYNGYKVTLTRETDIMLDKIIKTDLVKRAYLANDAKADVFVSVHINSNTANVYNGVSTYYYGESSSIQTDRVKLAKSVQKEILNDDSWKDMGTHGEDLSVLRNSKMPSVLVECGFLSNTSDSDKLSNETTLVNFGLNISNGIIKYLAEVK